jgi:hypothetical protein
MILLGPLELVSPIFLFIDGSDFREKVEHCWRHISTITTINVNQTCGMHVHLSPLSNSGSWTLPQIKAICRSIIYFEFAFEVLLPLHRRQNVWAKSNFYDNEHFTPGSLTSIFNIIDRCQSIPGVLELMNDGDDKYFGWNFLNLLNNNMATIEFRRAPGVTDAEDCLAWVEFTVTFVEASVQYGATLADKHWGVVANVQELKEFLGRVTVSGGEPARLRDIFRGKSGALFPQKVKKNLFGYSSDEMKKIETLQAKEKKKSLIGQKMRQSKR